MNHRNLMKTLAGVTIVYAAMAACSSSGASSGLIADGGLFDAMLDGVVDPVNDARAAAPIVVVAACDKQWVHSVNGATYFYAEAAFPGKTVEELTAVRVLGMPADPGSALGGGAFSHILTAAGAARPGYVAAPCGAIVSGQASYNYSGPLTFVLQP